LKENKLKIFILLSLVLLSQKVYSFNDNFYYNLDKYVDRAKQENRAIVKWDNELNNFHLATREQIKNRVLLLKKYINKYYYDFNFNFYRHELFNDLYSIVEHETGWIKYRDLDNGKSFGIASMRFSTYNWVRLILKKDEVSKTKLIKNVDIQIEAFVYYYFLCLAKFKNRQKAIIAYNRGINFNKKYIKDNYYYLQIQKNRDDLINELNI
jgi:hypothetical protein